jgi:ADP-ribosylglycohydrolase
MAKVATLAGAIFLLLSDLARAAPAPLTLPRVDYEDRVHAAWLGQIIGVLVTLPYEHNVSSVLPLTAFPKPYTSAIVDDDWYYEMVAVRGFEAHGPGMTVDQLGQLWLKHNCGTWGSSKYALEAMKRGVKPADAGLPQHNRLWFTIGPMFSCELYGLIAPGDPNLAGRLARELGRINGHAEGLDAGVFAAAVVSLAFRETDGREVVRQAAKLVHPDSPMRQAIDQVVQMAEGGATFEDVCDAVEDRWHIEYPATNNAVANGGILAACVWYAGGDFTKSMTLAGSAGDYVDADNIAAVACAVVGAMRGTKAVPADLVKQLNDRVAGADMAGRTKLTPPVDERISDLARRTAGVGAKVLEANGAAQIAADGHLTIPQRPVVTQPAQRFRLADLTKFWNPEWTLERAGFGGGDGGLGGIRGLTHLDGDTLATYPRDEVRGLVLRRTLTPAANAALTFRAGVDPKRAWNLDVFVDNDRVVRKMVQAPAGATERHWEDVRVDLSRYAGRPVQIRLFQRVLIDGKTASNAYWAGVRVE